MKKINLICLGFFLSISGLIAATTETIYLNFYEQVIIRQKDGESYSKQYSGGIGKYTILQYPNSTFIDRSVFRFDLSDIDDHAVINSVTVYTYCSGSGYTFRLTKISSLSPSDSEIWNEIGAGTALCSGLDYGYNVTNSDAFKTAIQNALVSDELIVGALSEAETTIGSASDIYIQLEVEYTVPLLNLQAKNDLYGGNGGNIGVGVNVNAVSYPSPYIFTAYEGDMLSLKAYDDQTINNKVWFFNDQEYPIRLSSWRKKGAMIIFS